MARADALSDARRAPAPRLSVVVPVHDDAEGLRGCLASVCAGSSPAVEVIVVDDGSRDHPERVVADFAAELVRAEERGGAGRARNLGVRRARGEVVLFTDADCEVTADWAERLAAALLRAHELDPAVVAVSGRIDSAPGWVEKSHAYAGYAYVQGGAERETECFNTANAAIFRSAFDELGGFEPSFAAHEDHDFGLRLAEAGLGARFVPEVGVYHHHGVHTLGQMLRKHAGWGRAAGLRIETRHPRRLGPWLGLLRHPVSHFLLVAPLALATTLKIVRHLLPIDRRAPLYAPGILLAKLAFRWAIFRHRDDGDAP